VVCYKLSDSCYRRRPDILCHLADCYAVRSEVVTKGELVAAPCNRCGWPQQKWTCFEDFLENTEAGQRLGIGRCLPTMDM
jgi:hypothetical protein